MEAIEIASPQLHATILTQGASLAQLHVADRWGVFGDVLLGFAAEAGWQCAANPCMGSIVGRVAGRTAPHLVVDEVLHLLPGCDGGGGGIRPSTNLHGGLRMNRDVWTVRHKAADAVTLATVCSGQVSGFPGALETLSPYALDVRLPLCLIVCLTCVAAQETSSAAYAIGQKERICA